MSFKERRGSTGEFVEVHKQDVLRDFANQLLGNKSEYLDARGMNYLVVNGMSSVPMERVVPKRQANGINLVEFSVANYFVPGFSVEDSARAISTAIENLVVYGKKSAYGISSREKRLKLDGVVVLSDSVEGGLLADTLVSRSEVIREVADLSLARIFVDSKTGQCMTALVKQGSSTKLIMKDC